jgi:hypothetical protein
MNLLILLSGVILVNNQPSKELLENITKTQVVEQYKIIPDEIIQKQLVAKKKTTQKKKTTKKKVVKKKTKKKVVKKKSSRQKRIAKRSVNKRVRYNVGEIQSYAHQLVIEYGWTEEDYQVLVLLWYRESSWNPNAINKKSGACGIPQALPCRKMASEGKDYLTNYRTQVRWGLKYIKARYGSPSGAWSHSQSKGWY